jgi:hypothetical protein
MSSKYLLDIIVLILHGDELYHDKYYKGFPDFLLYLASSLE